MEKRRVIVADICDVIEEFAPLSYQENYDNAGLIIGHRDTEVKGILICLDVSQAAIEKAILLGANMIVSHHPLIFNAVKKINYESQNSLCIVDAIRNNIAIYAAHTNIDSVKNGVSGMLAKKIGLNKCDFLSPADSNKTHGLGMVGDLVESYEEKDFLHYIKSKLNCKNIRFSSLRGKKVNRVAVAGGACSEFLLNALQAGADVLITADAKYHEFQLYAKDIILVDAGHFETEECVKDVFLDIISKKFPTFAVRVFENEKNPVNYL